MQYGNLRLPNLKLFYRALMLALTVVLGLAASAQQQKLVSCKPIEQRTQPEGCWIVASKPLGKLPAAVFWTLDVYPTRERAQKKPTQIMALLFRLLKKFGCSRWGRNRRFQLQGHASRRSDLFQ
jgi:hypothetical protein